MKRLKKGFTLIELLVVIAIIGILATTLAPKLREQLAKAKDAKSIALLGGVRTAAGVVMVDTMVSSPAAVTIAFSEVMDKLDTKSNEIITDAGDIAVGGIRPSGNALEYGGTVAIYQDLATDVKMSTSATISIVGDDVDLFLKAVAAGGSGALAEATDQSTEGKVWIEY